MSDWINVDEDWVTDNEGHDYNLSDVPSPGADIFSPVETPPLPSWVTGLRDHQWSAAVEIIEAFDSGVDVVWLDAPTGSGKTLIAELVRRMMDKRAWYICSTKSLQDQFHNDFEYSKVLKGRSNYATLSQPYPEYSAADCTKSGVGDDAMCYWCPVVNECPYEVAKNEAMLGKLGIINTSYFLTETNLVARSRVHGRKLVIADECDVLENELMGFVTFNVSDWRLKKLGLHAPKKGVHKKTIIEWFDEQLIPLLVKQIKGLPRESADIKVIRERSGLTGLLGEAQRILIDLTDDLETGNEDGETGSNWIRDNDAGPMVLKPVQVGRYGYQYLWDHGHKWLCMSGSIISSDEMNQSLGVYEAGLQSATVKVPMTFPVEHRPIKVVPVARMTFNDKEKSWPIMAQAVVEVMKLHPHDRILVHTVSYALSAYLTDHILSSRKPLISYSNSTERDSALARYRRTPGAVLFAASMDRGVDLKDDDCRVVVIAKVPFPNIGDRQVSARLNSGIEGQVWYDVQTIRTIIQMSGRGVRSDEDYCTTYILDSMFLEKLYKKSKGLLPEWWKEAMTVEQVRKFVAP